MGRGGGKEGGQREMEDGDTSTLFLKIKLFTRNFLDNGLRHYLHKFTLCKRNSNYHNKWGWIIPQVRWIIPQVRWTIPQVR